MGFSRFAFLALTITGSLALARTYEVEERSPLAVPLSFDELSHLKPAERLVYIRELREILAEIESTQESEAPKQARWEVLPSIFPPIFHLWSSEQAYSQAGNHSCVISSNGVRRVIMVENEGACEKLKLQPEGQQTPGSMTVPRASSTTSTEGAPSRSVTLPPRPPVPQTGGAAPPPPTRGLPPVPAATGASKPREAPKKAEAAPSQSAAKNKDESCVDKTQPDSALSCKPNCRKRSAFYNSLKEKKKANCLIGGVFSEYADGQVRKGNCKSTSVKIGKAEFKCESGLTLCNPLLYCGEEKGGKAQSLCLKASESLTRSCAEKSKSNSCDPLKLGASEESVRKAWDEFVKKHEELCNQDRDFAKFFCDECNLLSQRIAELNKKTMKGKGAAASPSHSSGVTKESPARR